jgi:hypothetical protein
MTPEIRMKPCKFTFDDEKIFDGFAHGSTWNGFDNVAVTKETLEEIIKWAESHGSTAEEIEDYRGIEPMENGLISLGWGYATQIVGDADDEEAKTKLAQALANSVK